MKYIAYGSNMVESQMAFRCPNARLIGMGYLPKHRLEFYLHATVEPSRTKGPGVPVAVWEIDEADERSLDRYEGFPRFYYKAELTLPITGIRSGKVRTRPVFAYIMHEDRPLGIPSQYYMKTCLDGYRSFGFDAEKLWDAVDASMEVRE